MFLARVSINRPIMITMFIMVFVVFGAMAYFTLSMNLMPTVDIPYITIQTVYPGAGPNEVETQITKKIEDAVSTISRIDKIESYSMQNVSYIIMAFELDKEVDVASAEVKEKVDAIINDFPDDSEKPSIEKFDITSAPIMELVFSGDKSGKELFQIADQNLKDRLSQIEGVAKVNVSGGEKREIQVEFDDRVVFKNRLNLQQIGQIIASQNLDMPGGNFSQEDLEYSVKLDGEFNEVKNLENIEVPTPFGIKKLSQLAEITDGAEEVKERSIYFSNFDKLKQDNIVRLSIVKTSKGNPVDISEAVRNELKLIRNDIPSGTSLEIIDDDSDFIQSAVEDTIGNVLLGILFTGLVLLFFLHDLRSTLIVAIAMPTSLVSTFLALQIFDFSINMLSLMGLSTSVGILVTNSVVVLENIFRHKEMGHDKKVSAFKGTSEIMVAVIASTLTNIAVFLPLAMMNTIAGHFLREFALTVTVATVFSLLVSFTLTPMLASIILPHQQKKKRLGQKMEAMFHRWEDSYQKILGYIIRNKIVSILVILFTIVIFIASFGLAKQIGFEFMTKMDQGNIKIDYELPEGYNLDETAAMYDQVQNRIEKYPEVKHILTSLGSQGSTSKGTNLGQIAVKLVSAEKREISSEEVAQRVIKDLSSIPNAKFKVSVQSSGGGGGQADIEFYLVGQDIDKLEKYAQNLLANGKEIPGLINFDKSSRPGKPEISIVPRKDDLIRMGISTYDLALTLRAAVEGIVTTQYEEAGEEYDIRISLSEESVNTPEDIKNIPVITKRGSYRISQLANVDFSETSTMINHYNKYVSIKFTGDLGMNYTQSEVMNRLNKTVKELKLPEGYKINWAGNSEMMQENNREMAKAFMIAILLTYMLLAAILESFAKPLLILLTIPLALIGVFAALYITGQTFNMVSMLAIIMLVGIVVNAAILIMDYTQQLRESGKNTHDALLEAAPTKLKPIVMSAAAIILGMLPMALGIGTSGAEIRMPLGIVSIGGLIVSTLLTLFVVPALYYISTKSKIEKTQKV